MRRWEVVERIYVLSAVPSMLSNLELSACIWRISCAEGGSSEFDEGESEKLYTETAKVRESSTRVQGRVTRYKGELQPVIGSVMTNGVWRVDRGEEDGIWPGLPLCSSSSCPTLCRFGTWTRVLQKRCPSVSGVASLQQRDLSL